LPIGGDPDVLAFDPSLRRLYVAAESGVVAVFEERDCSLGQLGWYRAPKAHSVAVDPAAHRVYLPLADVSGRDRKSTRLNSSHVFPYTTLFRSCFQSGAIPTSWRSIHPLGGCTWPPSPGSWRCSRSGTAPWDSSAGTGRRRLTRSRSIPLRTESICRSRT